MVHCPIFRGSLSEEPAATYGRDFGAKKGILIDENSYFCDVRRYYSWVGVVLSMDNALMQ